MRLLHAARAAWRKCDARHALTAGGLKVPRERMYPG